MTEPSSRPSPDRAAEKDRLLHKPVRFYSECDCTYPPEEEPLPDEDPRYFTEQYEDAYLESHFSIGDGDFSSCERAFDGHGCSECSVEREDMVDWPCPLGDASLPVPGPMAGVLTDCGDHFEVQ